MFKEGGKPGKELLPPRCNIGVCLSASGGQSLVKVDTKVQKSESHTPVFMKSTSLQLPRNHGQGDLLLLQRNEDFS